jgi:hypothetical protein
VAKKTNKYIINGTSVPGVTTIIGYKVSRQLCYWYGKNGTKKCSEISDEAKHFGDKVHTIIGGYISGQALKLDGELQDILDNFKLVTEGWKWLESEKVLLNDEFMYGGTADAICEIDGVKTLVDVKTGGLYDGQETVQLSAYMKCLPDVKQARILHLDKETNAWEVLHQETDGVFEVFQAFKKIYDYETGRK